MKTIYIYSLKVKAAIAAGAILLALCMTFVFFISETKIKKIKLDDLSGFQEIDAVNSTVGIAIDQIINDDNNLIIVGWAAKFGDKILKYNCHAALLDSEEERLYVLPTSMMRREGVTLAYGMTDSEYDLSGFDSRAMKCFLPDNIEKMEIIIVYQNNDENMICHTGQYVSVSTGG